MDALLEALEPRRRRGPVIAALLLGAIGLGLGLGLVLAPESSVAAVEPVDPCADAGRAIDGSWSEARRADIAAEHPEEAAVIDGWVERWTEVARRSCEEVHVERMLPESSLLVRRSCLGERVDELEVLLDAIASFGPSPRSVPGRWLAVLEDPHGCASPSLLTRAEGQASEPLRERVSQIRRELLIAHWGLDEADLSVRRERAAALHQLASELAHPPLVGRAAVTCGHLAYLAGDAEAARSWFGLALDEAAKGDALVGGDAWLGLHDVALELELDLRRAAWAAQRFERALEQLPASRWQRARAALAHARRELVGGQLELAEASARRGVELLEGQGSEQDWELSLALRQLAAIVEARGRFDAALALQARARVLEGGGSGQPDPFAGENRMSEALTELSAGRWAQAERAMLEALELQAGTHGHDSLAVANVHVGLASIYDGSGALEQARRHAELADSTLRRAVGPQHPDRIYTLSALGTVSFRQGRFKAAAELFSVALTVAEAQLEGDAPVLASCRANLGEALHELGREREAELLLRAAIESLERSLGPDHAGLAVPRKALGAVALANGELELAERSLERALASFAAAGEGGLEAAQSRWLLAQVLAADGQRERATSLARAAARDFQGLGPPWTERAAAIAIWIDSPSSSPNSPKPEHQP
jgi:eukaryotic-like serine/threonine-protein kinase